MVSKVILTTSSIVVWRTWVSASNDLTIPVCVVNASPAPKVPLTSFNKKLALGSISSKSEVE